jgi:hypothetical protein
MRRLVALQRMSSPTRTRRSRSPHHTIRFILHTSDSIRIRASLPYVLAFRPTLFLADLFIDDAQGLPKEWQQLLQDSGVSQEEQAAHPQAIAEIVAFYQDATKGTAPGGEQDDVWKKFGKAPPAARYGGPGPIQFEQPVSWLFPLQARGGGG